MYPGDPQAALRAIEHSVLVILVLAALFAGGSSWAIMALRVVVLRFWPKPFLINSLAGIGLVLAGVGANALVLVAIEPAALLQGFIGVWCLPPSPIQSAVPFVALGAGALVHGIARRSAQSRLGAGAT